MSHEHGGQCCASCARGATCEVECPKRAAELAAFGGGNPSAVSVGGSYHPPTIGDLRISDGFRRPAVPPPSVVDVPAVSIVGCSECEIPGRLAVATRRALARGETIGAFIWPWETEAIAERNRQQRAEYAARARGDNRPPPPPVRRPSVVVRTPDGRPLPPPVRRPKPPARPPESYARPPGMAHCTIWSRYPLAGGTAGARVQSVNGWTRYCYPPPAPVPPPEPGPTPEEAATLEQIAALVQALQAMDDDTLSATMEANPWIPAFLAELGLLPGATTEGGVVSGLNMADVRRADDVFSSVWDSVKGVVPYGTQIDAIHRARRGIMYGEGADAATMIREAQALWRRRWSGDVEADREAGALKARAASGDAEARKRWGVYVAVAKDDLRRASVS